MSEEVVRILLSIALAVVSGGIGIATIYLKKRWSAEEFRTVLEVVDAAVRASEMMGAALGWDAEAKKAWAIDWAAGRTGLSADEIASFVEAAVARLKAAGGELTKRGNAVVVKS